MDSPDVVKGSPAWLGDGKVGDEAAWAEACGPAGAGRQCDNPGPHAHHERPAQKSGDRATWQAAVGQPLTWPPRAGT